MSKPVCQCFESREGTVRFADQSACLVHAQPCECGEQGATWESYGSGRRLYACKACHEAERASERP